MEIFSYSDSGYADFIQTLDRRALPGGSVAKTVSAMIADIQERGDAAVFGYTSQFDKADLTAQTVRVTAEEIAEAEATVSDETKKAIAATRANIHDYSRHSLKKNWTDRNAQGAEIGERFTPYDRVGIYIPGGKAPLVSTALMTGAFAQAAGVPEIVAATPVGADLKVNPALLYALVQAGASEILKVGGAQAIAMMALGTESVRPVEKIFGPGNPFVVEAKRQLIGAVSIDLLPGPSEILVVSDDSGNPAFIAADLLAQAEHGGDSVIGFFTTSADLVEKVKIEIEQQAANLTRGAMIREVLEKGTFVVITETLDQAIDLCNDFAPEHLSLIVEDEDHWLPKVKTSGAIYVGNYSPVAVGDFLAGPSHTLPTGGSAKSFSGLRADQFQRRTSIVKLDRAAVEKSVPAVSEFARVEGLDAHGYSTVIRVERG